MNKTIIAIWFLIMSGVCSAETYDSWLYGQIYKDVNGSYVWQVPKLEYNTRENGTIREFTLSMDWTSSRGNGMVTVPNHYQVKAEYNLGYEWHGWFATFGIDGRYVFAQNDYGIPEGIYFGNLLRVGKRI